MARINVGRWQYHGELLSRYNAQIRRQEKNYYGIFGFQKNIIDLILENFQSTFGWVKNIGG
mgnify:CR=1 FL=1